MSFDWSQYLNLAKELADEATTSANQEARFRAAIHLAYYAAFNFAKDHLQNKEGHSTPKTGDVHKYVAEQFDLSSDPVRQLLANKLKRLRKFRNQADYVAVFPGLATFAKRSIKLAEEAISTLSSL
jgi:uncharacterized protein (UPF0332 family)